MEENTACVLISSNGDLIRRLGVDTVSLALFVPSLLATLHGQEPVDVHITWHQRYFEMLPAAITECYDHDVLREYLRILAMLLGWKEELAPRIAARIKVGSAMIAGLEETERFREAILTTLEHKAFGFRGQIVASRVRYVAKEAIQPSLSRFTSRLWGKDEKDWLQIQAADRLLRERQLFLRLADISLTESSFDSSRTDPSFSTAALPTLPSTETAEILADPAPSSGHFEGNRFAVIESQGISEEQLGTNEDGLAETMIGEVESGGEGAKELLAVGEGDIGREESYGAYQHGPSSTPAPCTPPSSVPRDSTSPLFQLSKITDHPLPTNQSSSPVSSPASRSLGFNSAFVSPTPSNKPSEVVQPEVVFEGGSPTVESIKGLRMVGQGSESQLFEGSARRSSETVGSAEGSEDASTMEETSYTSSKSGQWMGKNEPLTPPRGSPFAPQPRFSVGGSTIASVTSSPSVDYGEDGLANNQLEDILLNDPSRLVSVLNNVGSDVENDLLALLIKRERVRTGNFDLDVFAVGGSTYGNFKDKGTSQMIIDNLLEEKTSSDYIVGKIVENGEATLSLLDHLWESDTVVEDKRVLAMSEDGLRARSGDLASIWISTSAPSLVNALGDSTELGLQLFPNSESNGHFLALVLSTLRTLRTEAPIKFDTHFDPVVPNLHLFHQLNSALSTLQGTPPLSIDSPASCAELLKKIAFVTVRLKATSGEMCVSSEQRTACDSIQYEAFIGLRRLEGGESVEYSVSLLSELLELGSPFGVGKGDMPLDSVQNGCMSAAAKGLGQLDLLLTERREEEGDSEAGGSSAQSSDEAGGAPSSPTTQPDPNHFLAFLTTTTTTTTTQRDPSPSTTTTSAANPSASPFVTIHTFEPTMKAYSLGRPIESHGVVFEPEDTLMSEAEARAREVAEEAFKSTLNRAVQRGQDGLEIEYGSNPSYFEALLHRLDQSFKYADPAALIPSTEPVADVYAIAVDTDPDAPTSDQQKADKIFSLAKTIKSATQKFGGVFGRRGKKA